MLFQRLVKGFITKVTTQASVTAEVVGVDEALSNTISDVTTSNCPYQFGSYQCGVTPTLAVGVVQSTSGTQFYSVDIPGGLPLAVERYAAGVVRVVSGPAAGTELDIASLSASGGTLYAITLLSVLSQSLPIGTVFGVYNGCTKNLASCEAYGNLNRGRHLPYLRGSSTFTNSQGLEG